MKEKNMSKTNQQGSSSSFKARFLYDLYTIDLYNYEGTDYEVTDDADFIASEDFEFQQIECLIDDLIDTYVNWKSHCPNDSPDDFYIDCGKAIEPTFRLIKSMLCYIKTSRVKYHLDKLKEGKK